MLGKHQHLSSSRMCVLGEIKSEAHLHTPKNKKILNKRNKEKHDK